MTFRRSDLQEAFFVPGTCAFRVLGYGTSDPLEAVLAPAYFATAGGLLQPGDLVYVRAGAGNEDLSGARAAAVRMVLLMVRTGGRGGVSVRLVQDFGRTDEPDSTALSALKATATPTPAPPKRGRGRPAGSRNRKNGMLGFHADHQSQPEAARALAATARN
jgi:hypothetical protein